MCSGPHGPVPIHGYPRGPSPSSASGGSCTHGHLAFSDLCKSAQSPCPLLPGSFHQPPRRSGFQPDWALATLSEHTTRLVMFKRMAASILPVTLYQGKEAERGDDVKNAPVPHGLPSSCHRLCGDILWRQEQQQARGTHPSSRLDGLAEVPCQCYS